MKEIRQLFLCANCGYESIKWLGRCPSCRQWNCFDEHRPATVSRRGKKALSAGQPQELSSIQLNETERITVPIGELSRVLGGGLVRGSLVLVGGEPGIGKSTLLLQASGAMSQKGSKIIYVSGEESQRQIKLRAQRLGISGEGLYLLAETDLEAIIATFEQLTPQMVVIDSIQTVFLNELEASPGSVGQVRECTLRLMQWAKEKAIPVIIAGHVTKEGAIAGPRVLEHIVDAVLYMEGEPFSSYRILRCTKNRFGSVSEVGIFEMKAQGLIEVENPSEVFISRHKEDIIGSAVVPLIEGSRPLLVEIQALTNVTVFGQPRRTANGLDYARLLMVCAVLTRRAAIKLGNQDVIASAAGGIKAGEPAADLALALAIASSAKDLALMKGLAAIGEIGLSGELRPVPQIDRRLAEAARLGFSRCIIPAGASAVIPPKGVILIEAATIKEAIYKGLNKKKTEEQNV
jgi:DNA repair protein RadA/Sms